MPATTTCARRTISTSRSTRRFPSRAAGSSRKETICTDRSGGVHRHRCGCPRQRPALAELFRRHEVPDDFLQEQQDRAERKRSVLTVQAASIDTGVDARDNDLRSPNYFDVTKYPTISFKSSRIEPKGNDQYDVTGEFSMHGVTKTIRVLVKALGFGRMGKTE